MIVRNICNSNLDAAAKREPRVRDGGREVGKEEAEEGRGEGRGPG